MKAILALANAFALTSTAFATGHGPVLGYATPVSSQDEVSCDTGIYGRNGTQGTQFSTGTGYGYGVTPHFTISVFLPATFGNGSLPESHVMPSGEWSVGASGRFLHSVTSVGKRIKSTASLGIVVPGPQQDSGVLAGLHRAPGVAGTLASGFASRSQYAWVGAGDTNLRRPRMTGDRTPSPGAVFTAIALPGFAVATTSGTTQALRNSLESIRVMFDPQEACFRTAARPLSGLHRPYLPFSNRRHRGRGASPHLPRRVRFPLRAGTCSLRHQLQLSPVLLTQQFP